MEKLIIDAKITSTLGIGSQVLDGKFAIETEVRKKYGTDATAINLEAEDGRYIKMEFFTHELIEALIKGGWTADDLRLWADIEDGALYDGERIIQKAPTIPDLIKDLESDDRNSSVGVMYVFYAGDIDGLDYTYNEDGMDFSDSQLLDAALESAEGEIWESAPWIFRMEDGKVTDVHIVK